MTQTELTPTASLTGKWKPYSAYKDLGVEWLGEIPEHWEVKRLKYIAVMNPDVLSEDTDSNHVLRYIDISNVDSNGILLNAQELQFGDAPSRARRTVKHGDIIISTVRTYLRAIGLIEKPPENLVVSTGFAVLRLNSEAYYKFLWRLAQSSEFVDAVVSHSEGVGYPAINPNRLADLPVWLPPLPEQRAIAAFLDRETASINALIAKKERLIELLREKRAALISHAVTKGLDPTVPMKDSGVEWLGEIPEHWEVLQLRRIVNTFVDYRGFTPVKTSDGIPLITARNIKNGVLDFSSSQEFISEEDYANRMVRGFPENGDVLITTEAPLGETAQIVDERVTLAQRIILLKVDQALITNECLKFYFMSGSGKGELWSRATGSTAIGIKASHLREVFIIIPSLSEQQAIVSYLDRETAKIDALVSRIREGFEKLKEYSTALISAAVTGKIDVRETIEGFSEHL